MAQRMFNLTKWMKLAEGQSFHFHDDRQRMVEIEVNSPSEVALYVVQAAADIAADPERVTDEAAGRALPAAIAELAKGDRGEAITFLGLVRGRDRLEFGVEGEFDLVVEGGPVMVYTTDSQDFSTRILAPVIFTRIMNRRARNPQLELMQYMMKLNAERMYGELEAESTRRMEAMEKRLESYAPERNSGTPLEKARVKQPVEAGVGDTPGAPVGEAGADEGKGKGGGAGGKKRKEAPGSDDDPGTLV